jgi:hypothetical protein
VPDLRDVRAHYVPILQDLGHRGEAPVFEIYNIIEGQ